MRDLSDADTGPEVAFEVHLDLPGVGENLQDRYEVGLISKMKGDFGLLEGATFSPNESDPFFREWKVNKQGVYATNGVIICLNRFLFHRVAGEICIEYED